MDVNMKSCTEKGEALGKIAKKKTALKYQMQNVIDNLTYIDPKESLEKLILFCTMYEIDAIELIEIMAEGNKEDCQKACQSFIFGFTNKRLS